jgi:carboxypeptidase Q
MSTPRARSRLRYRPAAVALFVAIAAPGPTVAEEASPLRRLQQAALADDLYMPRLEALCDDVGARLAGSPALARAVGWAEQVLRDDGHVNVRRESVPVPVWVRGEERLEVLEPHYRPLAVLALGGTVGTSGVEGPVVVVSSFEQLSRAVAGTIVLFNQPMAATLRRSTSTAWRPVTAERGLAAEHGARVPIRRSPRGRWRRCTPGLVPPECWIPRRRSVGC